MDKGIYFFNDEDPLLRDYDRIDWEHLFADVIAGLDPNDKSEQHALTIIREEFEFEQDVETAERDAAFKKEVRSMLARRNGLPSMSGKWRKEAYPLREYLHITEYAITESITEKERIRVRELLATDLNGYIGTTYLDDCNLTEAWMVSFRDRSSRAPSTDDIVRTQVESVLDGVLGTPCACILPPRLANASV